MAVGLTEDEWRQILKLSEAVAGLSFAGRLRFLESASISPEIMTHVLELTPADASSLESSYGGEPSPKIHPASRLRIGRFTTMECLGAGGMGEVWSAHDSSLDRTVALKFFFPGALAGLSDQQIIREARAASALNHPNIVTIHEIVQSENIAALVMELVDGTALRQLIGKPLPGSEFLKIGLQIADALTAAHAGGIIHGDIKPENILFRRDGHIKVLDFGLARRIAGESGGMGFVGTLRYMSPEQIEGEHLTPATDIFSFGLVLFELSTGQHPFPSESPVETAKAILTTSPQPRSSINLDLTESLNAFFIGMLARDPAQRPSAKQVAQFLEAEAARQNRDTSSDRAVTQTERLDFVNRPPALFRKKSQRVVWIGALLLLGAALAWIAFFQIRKPAASGNPGALAERSASSGLPELNIHPLTAQPGWEFYPALSPDGKSVAFTWTGDLKRARPIYVKRFDSEAPVLLFEPPPNEMVGPLAWSPDGSKLTFKTSNDQFGGIWIIPSSGGAAVKLTNLGSGNPTSSIDWSPDGSRIVFSDCWPDCSHLAIFSLDLLTSRKQRLTNPPLSDWGDWDPKYSPDGKQIAFKRVSGFWRDALYLMPANGGSVRAVTGNSKGIWGHVWSPEGDALIVSTQGSGTVFGIWRYPLQLRFKPQRITEGGVDAITPTSARLTNRIAWVDQTEDSNIYRVPLTGNGVPQKLIASTRHDQSANYASDGRIAFASDRSGSWEIWIASPDGSHLVRATNLSGPVVGCPRWSPDTRYIAFERLASGHNRIVVMKCQAGIANCEGPVPLTAARETDPFSEERPWWSADGAAIYFASNRVGNTEIWKQSWPPAGSPVQMTQHIGLSPVESSDGRWLYYAKADPNAIWRLPLTHENSAASSSEQIMLGPLKDLLPYGWTLTPDELLFLFRGSSGRSSDIRAYGLRTRKLRNVAIRLPLQIPLQITDLSVSPDGRWLLYWQLDHSGSGIMVADSR